MLEKLAGLLLAGTMLVQQAPAQPCLYYNHDDFLDALTAAPAYTTEAAPVAGVVPHHLVAGAMIAGFLRLAANHADGYDRVVLVSPMHFPEQCGGASVATSTADWDTPFGTLKADATFARRLLRDTGLEAQNLPQAVAQDHGAAGLIPFIQYHLPGVSIVPVLLRHDVDEGQQRALLEHLYIEDGRTLVLVSVDFSHYLSVEQAAMHDAETAKAVRDFDYKSISSFTDANVDSNISLSLFLRVCEWQGAKPVQLDHSDSTQKLPVSHGHGAFLEGITSYFVYAGVAAGKGA